MGLFTQDQQIPSSVITEDAPVQMAFLQKVYSLFLLGLVSAVGGAFLVMSNQDLARALMAHFWMGAILYFGVFFLAITVRKTPGVNVLALLAFTFVSGAFLAPTLLLAVLKTGSFDVVLQAAGITGSIFVGLTAYTFISKKDFSFLSGFVFAGIMAVIGIGIVNIFVQSAAASLALAWISSVLFSLFVLYDTSRILRTHQQDEYVSGALSLYLDFINLFLAILQILTNNNRRN